MKQPTRYVDTPTTELGNPINLVALYDKHILHMTEDMVCLAVFSGICVNGMFKC